MKGSKAVPNNEKPVRGELLSITEAAKKTRLGKDFFYRHMENGTLPFPWFMLTPGKRFMDSADIDEWLRLMKIPAGRMPGDLFRKIMEAPALPFPAYAAGKPADSVKCKLESLGICTPRRNKWLGDFGHSIPLQKDKRTISARCYPTQEILFFAIS